VPTDATGGDYLGERRLEVFGFRCGRGRAGGFEAFESRQQLLHFLRREHPPDLRRRHQPE
jgi:hypothetical protein